ncbi:MAG: hypothetical protein DWG83_01925 [Chloroflexi bacterium]|nr:hypothetical protein [Chloroflexota bacterium]MDA1240521.1 hypothetical protein [Chloroflexota bacterium]MQC19315.1 hypothetical protein [Chloroflexota bacterium]
MFVVESATVVAFDGTGYTATLRFAASLASVVAGVPVSRAIDGAEMTAGRRVAVAVFDATHPADAMVVGVH